MSSRLLALVLGVVLVAPAAAQDPGMTLLGEKARVEAPVPETRRAPRPDPSKPWIVLPSAGGVKIVQITSVKVTISRGSKKSDGSPGWRRGR